MDAADLLAGLDDGGLDEPLSPEKSGELNEILKRIKDQMAGMSEDEREQLRGGFMENLANKVRMAAESEAQRGIASQNQGLLLLGALLVLFSLFGLVGYTIYQYVNKQENKKSTRVKSKKQLKQQKQRKEK
ncbi:uncharacterized protein LOC135948389 [Cloeon dipterum]|uniref:uncharacterized protein LOC135948389 n=1 Tax=Cloeon dipterum TaxID=197152 RepID=UPI0032205254